MTKLLQKIQAYHQAEKDVLSTITEQVSQIQVLNKEISDYLHILELLPLKASQIAKVTSKLREALKERRDLKLASDLSCNINNPILKSFKILPAETLLQTYVDKRDKYVEEAIESYNKHF